MQVLADLAIVCVLGILWMLNDGKASGVMRWPSFVLTLAAGERASCEERVFF